MGKVTGNQSWVGIGSGLDANPRSVGEVGRRSLQARGAIQSSGVTMSSEMVIGTVNTALGEISLLQILGKAKSGYSFLAELNGQPVVFKRMHNEPYPCYTSSGNRVQLEVRAYQTLQQLGIPIPELLGFDLEQQYLVKKYIDGPCGHEWLAQDGQDETIIEQLFSIASKLEAHDLNIDYFPANFVIAQGGVYYVDYEINPYSDDWSLEQWGIYYWANRAGMAQYARSEDWRCINESVNPRMPIKAPFEAQVRKWMTKYKSN
jgi:TP53 regulating kinase and related kinases